MNDRQEAKFSMQRNIERHLESGSTIIAPVAAVPRASNRLKTLNAQIAAAAGIQETPRTGVATGKQTSKKELIEGTLKISKPTRAYALEIGDSALRDEMDYSYKDLNRLHDDQIAPRCQFIHDRVAALANELKDHGVTAEKLTAQQTLINNYKTESTKPRAARAARSVQTDNLEALFDESAEVLSIIDDLIDNFAEDHPDFVAEYKNLRELDDPATRPQEAEDAAGGNGNIFA